MSAAEGRGSAPPVVRRIGYYYLALSALGAWVLIMATLDDRVSWWQMIGVPVGLAIGIGLVLEKRWAYVLALVFTGINVVWNLVILVLLLIQPSHIWWVWAMIATTVNFAIVAPPLFLLGERARVWFQRREPAELSA
jgi:hypothetical protein